MDELEQIKKRKIEQMQQNQMTDEMQVAQQIQALEELVKQRLTRDALLRYGNLKAASPEKAVQLLVVLGQLVQKGHNQINDDELRQILVKLTPPKKEFKITRK